MSADLRSPDLRSHEPDFGPVAALAAFDALAERLPRRNAAFYPFVFQDASEPVSMAARDCSQSTCPWQAARQVRDTRIAPDLAPAGQLPKHADRALISFRYDMQLGVMPPWSGQ